MEDTTKMIVTGQCPHCAGGIVVGINTPNPSVDIMTPDEVDEDIKNAINQKEDDITQEPEAA
jgi:uncharacterized protein YbbK (DUF523 family)